MKRTLDPSVLSPDLCFIERRTSYIVAKCWWGETRSFFQNIFAPLVHLLSWNQGNTSVTTFEFPSPISPSLLFRLQGFCHFIRVPMHNSVGIEEMVYGFRKISFKKCLFCKCSARYHKSYIHKQNMLAAALQGSVFSVIEHDNYISYFIAQLIHNHWYLVGLNIIQLFVDNGAWSTGNYLSHH